MERVLRAALLLACTAVPAAAVADSNGLTVGAALGFVDTSGHVSWTDGFVGKLRHSDDGATLVRGFIDWRSRLTDTLDAHVVLDAYDDDIGNAIDVTEAYLEWRPVPRSPRRYRLKVGAFYPRISLENVAAGWSSPYTLSYSAINTWIAEELRAIGAELTMSWRPESLGGSHGFAVSLAAFGGNDPAGSLLAWKGWSVHDRQTRLGDKLPLPPLPQLGPGGLFERQHPYVGPIREIDGRGGYYVNGDWRIGQRLLLRATRYDNRANPEAIAGGQYAWRTEFDHFGIQMTLPGDVGLIAQSMTGATVMGGIVDNAHVVDTEFDSRFVLVTRSFARHRLTLRYDHFELTQNDRTPEDNNPDFGHAWTVNYSVGLSDRASIAAEWLAIDTDHCGWVYYGIGPTATERQMQLLVKLRF